MANRDIIVIGASMGGIEALQALAATLPHDLAAAIFVVQHIGPYGLGLLADLMAKSGPLPASNARDQEAIRPGHIFVAPPDRHLLLTREGRVRVTHGPKENSFAPQRQPAALASLAWSSPAFSMTALRGSGRSRNEAVSPLSRTRKMRSPRACRGTPSTMSKSTIVSR